MKIRIVATFELDLGKCNKEEEKQYLEDFEDFSVFMPKLEYENLKNINIKKII